MGRKGGKAKAKNSFEICEQYEQLETMQKLKFQDHQKKNHLVPHFSRKQDCEELGGPNVEY